MGVLVGTGRTKDMAEKSNENINLYSKKEKSRSWNDSIFFSEAS